MKIHSIFLFLFLGLGYQLMILGGGASELPQSSQLATYIVHIEPPNSQLSADPHQKVDLERYYLSFMPETRASTDEEQPRILFSYHHVFTGFAARLSAEDVKQMEKKVGFAFAHKEDIASLQTTYTPAYMGLNPNTGFWLESNYGAGIIIGVLDTGVVPDHPSFSGQGLPRPPAKWKGICQFGPNVCNNKLIGARNLIDPNVAPFDDNGHGTHVASTAAGNTVNGANVCGNAQGTAVGIAPLAHLAIYRVCKKTQCDESAVLAGMDAAIADGVDILSLSLGFPSKPFYQSGIAIGAFAAMEKGIFVSCAAGNDGPYPQTLTNDAPWVLTVGASDTDRKIRATVLLGNNRRLDGESACQPSDFPSSPTIPLIDPWRSGGVPASYCAQSSFPVDIRGKIVICSTGEVSNEQKGINVKNAGGAGMIVVNQRYLGYTTNADAHVLPATHVSYADAREINAYMDSTTSPKATILFQGTVFGDIHAPEVAAFSSRGPNKASIGILKPDILGPGVNILGACPPFRDPHGSLSYYKFMSGTSMACPHLSGVVALLKKTHPDWSPAAIKSAIMTTSHLLNLQNKPIEDQDHQPASMFAMGAGHVYPPVANNPGLIYDLTPRDYVPYLCGLGYTDQQISIIIRRSMDCSTTGSIPEAQLNYPSFSVVLGSSPQTYSRTVTNLVNGKTIYTAHVEQPQGVRITVSPAVLIFSRSNQRITYQVTFRLMTNWGVRNESVEGRSLAGTYADFQGSLTWTSDGSPARYSVRSPIVVLVQQDNALFPSEAVPLMRMEKFHPSQ